MMNSSLTPSYPATAGPPANRRGGKSPAPNQWLEIDLAAIKQNVQFLRGRTGPGTKFLAVVKSNAYGHGLVSVARAAIEAGAEWLGVNSAEEAIALRAAGISKPILVLGDTNSDHLSDLAEQRVAVVAASLEWLDSIKLALPKLFKPLAVHLKLETGTHRLGLGGSAAIELARQIRATHDLVWEGTYSHLAAVEESDAVFTRVQAAAFSDQLAALAAIGNPGIRHLSATAATLLYSEFNFDMVRCGIGIYGLWPSKEVQTSFESQNSHRRGGVPLRREKLKSQNRLRPALSWKTRIVQIKRVTDGTIGYGRTFRIEKPMTIAILPVGYADGYDRHLSNRGEVLVGGVRCPVVGRIAMNMSAIDLTSIAKLKSQNSNLRIGAEVVLIGRQGDEEITADELAEQIGTINYEIVTRLPTHLPRIYVGE